MKNNQIMIDKKPITEDYLLDIATELTTLSEYIELVRQPLELINLASINKDSLTVNHYIYSGKLQCVENNLEEIQNKIQELSNKICPDEM
ncbi:MULTISPECIES: hypothetical protein [Vagococcus]|uniref:hypothetical protein n=1 Tax=Vagococcus TaxID=2737 RepID=UPI001D0B5052|nr:MULTISPECIES: hypothetical protein [Vagococcus]MDT2831880.1 hypothetical protein [Vagococcus carniphilus]MDT2855390.1 hypothetical protein [Vagococcus carniphilus]UDM74071.1 hypothetical protein K5K99_00075 [Vagococcus fluvialis]